jgi:hypothetical protein
MKSKILILSTLFILSLFSVKSQTNSSSTQTGGGMDWTIQSGSYYSRPSKIVVDGDGGSGGSILIQSEWGEYGIGKITLNAMSGAILFNTDNITRMQIMNDGNITAPGTISATNLTASGTITATGAVNANGDWFRAYGTKGLYFQTYGGGFYMSDNNWIRTYNDKNIWTGYGLLGSNGGLTIGYGGAAPAAGSALISGSLGLGGTPGTNEKLYVSGNIKTTGNIIAVNMNANTATMSGAVCIGSSAPQTGYMLTVNGSIIAEEIKVITDVPATDYVFKKDYKLMSLCELEKYVNEHQHLPGIQSAENFKKNGYSVGQMDNLLLKQVEEIILHLIEMKKENEQLKKEIENLKNK